MLGLKNVSTDVRQQKRVVIRWLDFESVSTSERKSEFLYNWSGSFMLRRPAPSTWMNVQYSSIAVIWSTGMLGSLYVYVLLPHLITMSLLAQILPFPWNTAHYQLRFLMMVLISDLRMVLMRRFFLLFDTIAHIIKHLHISDVVTARISCAELFSVVFERYHHARFSRFILCSLHAFFLSRSATSIASPWKGNSVHIKPRHATQYTYA